MFLLILHMQFLQLFIQVSKEYEMFFLPEISNTMKLTVSLLFFIATVGLKLVMNMYIQRINLFRILIIRIL